ncbi:MAG: AAA family ATPase [Cyanobacteria bacterium]|nr:AAA family ATPase [Cyanobacteriota bacterium]
MKIILLISNNKEITDNIANLKPENLDLVVIKTEEYLSCYLEEYMPEFVIINIPLKEIDILKHYSSANPKATIFLNKSGQLQNKINQGIIYIDELVKTKDVKKVVDIISRIENENTYISDSSYKFVNQQIISLFSLKGGSGKTTVSFNLACFLKKIFDAKVLLMDLNFSEGPCDLSSYLKINQIPNLSYYIGNYTDGEEALKKSIILKDSNDIDILLPPLSLSQGSKLTSSFLGKLIILSRSFYNFVIIDLPHNFSELTFEAINLSDSLIMLSLPTSTCALKLSKFKIKNTPSGLQNKISILNNPYNFTSVSKNIFEDISGSPVLLEIPYFNCRDTEFLTFQGLKTDFIDMGIQIKKLINMCFLK